MAGYGEQMVPPAALRGRLFVLQVVWVLLAVLPCVGLSAEKEPAPAPREGKDVKVVVDLGKTAKDREATVKDVRELLKSKKTHDIELAALWIVSDELREFRKDLASIALEHKDKEARRVALQALLLLEEMDASAEQKKELLEARTKVLDTARSSMGKLDWDAVQEIRDHGLREFTEELEKTAKESDNADVRGNAISTLCWLATWDVEPFLGGMREKAQDEVGARKLGAVLTEEIKRLKENEKEVAKKLVEGTPAEKKDAIAKVGFARLSGCLPIVRKLALTDPMVQLPAFELLAEWKGTPAEETANVECFREALKSTRDMTRLDGATQLANRAERAGVECLVGLLKSENQDVRHLAILSLHVATDTRIPYDPFGDPARRADAARKWQEWFEKNKDRFK